MADRYITIAEAAMLKGVAPRVIHEALCSGELPAVLAFRADLDECRLVGRWELEQWAPCADGAGGRTEVMPQRQALAGTSSRVSNGVSRPNGRRQWARQ